MNQDSTGYTTKIDNKIDINLYMEILGDKLLKSLEYYNYQIEDIYFQQDNNPKHTSKLTKKQFQDNDFKVLYHKRSLTYCDQQFDTLRSSKMQS